MADDIPKQQGPADAASAAGESPSPPQIQNYQLLCRIGGGSYGEVWLARNVTGSYSAIKIVYRKSFDDERPYEREFKGIQKFEPISRSHESQVDILHVGRHERDEYFYYVMELADDQNSGQNIDPANYKPKTLKSEIYQRKKLPPDECLRIAFSLTTALGYLHGQKLVHRDIKPSNIIFINGAPKLADLGLVTKTDATKSFIGTQGYFPEQGTGTQQADLYSLGKVLYETATGKDREDFPELPTDLKDSPDRDALVNLNEIWKKACHSDPGCRYQSTKELLTELKLLETGQSIKRKRVQDGRRRLLKIAGIVGIVVLLSIVAIQFIITRPILFDQFNSPTLNDALWVSGETNLTFEGTGQRSFRIEQTNGTLTLEATAENELGWSTSQLAWIESKLNFKLVGDCVIYVELSGEARNGRLAIRFSDGSPPATHEDSTAITLFHEVGGNERTLTYGPNKIRIELFAAANLAVVSTGIKDQHVEVIDLSKQDPWKLRFFVTATTSAGFHSAFSRMHLTKVRVMGVRKRTGAFVNVRSAITGRPVENATVRDSRGKAYGHSQLDGFVYVATSPGSISLIAEKENYESNLPARVTLRPGQPEVIHLFLKKTRFEFGDAVESFNCAERDAGAFEFDGGQLYYAVNAGDGVQILKTTPESMRTGAAASPVIEPKERFAITGLVACRGELFVLSHWPGKAFVIRDRALETFCMLNIDWPKDAAFDGQLLWFVENAPAGGRHGLVALDLNTKELVKQFQSNDPDIRGLAWDGKHFWVSSISGRVYEIDPAQALRDDLMEAGILRQFKGHYSQLSYADGYLWGLDEEMRRLCKIQISGR